jgi:hypothetical protein
MSSFTINNILYFSNYDCIHSWYAITTTIADTTTKNNDFLTYENSDHGLTVQYHANWDKDEGIPILNEILWVGNIVPFTPSINTDITFEMV